MLTNPHDAFRGQSRSPNIVPFHMYNSNFKNVVTLKSGSEVTEGHWKWYHSIDWVWFAINVL